MPTDISDWTALRGAAEQAYDDSVFCRAVVEIISQGNNPRVIKAINADGSGAAVQLFWHSGHIAAHLFLTRAFAPVRRGDRHLAAMVEFLKKPGVIEQRPDPRFQDLLTQAVELFGAVVCDPMLAGIIHMRNKMLAHWAVPTPGVDLPTYDEFYALTARVSEIAELIALGSGAVMFPLDAELVKYRSSAAALWRRW